MLAPIHLLLAIVVLLSGQPFGCAGQAQASHLVDARSGSLPHDRHAQDVFDRVASFVGDSISQTREIVNATLSETTMDYIAEYGQTNRNKANFRRQVVLHELYEELANVFTTQKLQDLSVEITQSVRESSIAGQKSTKQSDANPETAFMQQLSSVEAFLPAVTPLLQRAFNAWSTEIYRRSVEAVGQFGHHLMAVHTLASQCDSVTEVGVLPGFMTNTLRAALLNRPGQTKLVGVDIEQAHTYEHMMGIQLFTRSPIDIQFFKESSLIWNCSATDMIILDTVHVYGQLTRELARHHRCARKFLVIGATSVAGTQGDAPKSLYTTLSARGMSPAEIQSGVWPAIGEFLLEHQDEWHLVKRYEDDTGLTIIARTNATVPELPEPHRVY